MNNPVFLALLLFSAVNLFGQTYDSIIDQRDGQKYLTIKIDKKITDSNIDKIKNKLLIPLKFKNINFDLKNFDIGVDYMNNHDNIETIDIHSSINEFVDSMSIKYKDEIKTLIEQKIINYEQ
jgi:hypothetical protein